MALARQDEREQRHGPDDEEHGEHRDHDRRRRARVRPVVVVAHRRDIGRPPQPLSSQLSRVITSRALPWVMSSGTACFASAYASA